MANQLQNLSLLLMSSGGLRREILGFLHWNITQQYVRIDELPSIERTEGVCILESDIHHYTNSGRAKFHLQESPEEIQLKYLVLHLSGYPFH